MISLFAVPLALASFLPTTAPPAAATVAAQQAAAYQVTARQAVAVMALVRTDITLLGRDEAQSVRTTAMAAITNDTTQMESQLQSVPVPTAAKTAVTILTRTAYKLGYDAASLQPVIGTTDTSLLHILNNQVTADESVLNADGVAVESVLNPLTIARPTSVIKSSPAVTKSGSKATANLTWHNWRNATIIQEVVRPVIATGWHLLEILTGISVIVMIRRLFRRSHGLTP
jgi:hypothetical protein